MWMSYCREVTKTGCGLVWRVEVQQRGALHWHGILIGPPAVRYGTRRVTPEWVAKDLYWIAVIKCLPIDEGGAVGAFGRMGLPGAWQHSVVVEVDRSGGTRGAWLRYLQDHATKQKQAQVGENIGRHWGVVGRRAWVQLMPEVTEALTVDQYARWKRAYQRLATPTVQDKRSPFGRRLGWRCRRGDGHGTVTIFGRPETHKRLVEWAKGGGDE